MTDTRAALRLTDVRKSFVGVAALKGVTFEVHPGEVHALLGENGAGKSTLMSIAAGSLLPDEGTVEIGGTEMDTPSPSAAQALGLGVVYQHPAVLEDLSVTENLVLAAPADRRPSGSRAAAWAREQLGRIDASDIDVGLRGSDLTPAQRQLVEIAKALSIEPRVLVLDEPTAALNQTEVDALFARVRRIRENGTAIVYISHRIPEVVAIADRLTVLRDGEQKGTFAVTDVTEEEIVRLILGRRLDATFPDKPVPAPDQPLLELDGLSGDGFDDVTLTIRRGEIHGFAGAEGNGQRQALRALAGLTRVDGQVTLDGREVGLGSPGAADAAGFYFVPGDRQNEGLFKSLSIRENVAVSALGQLASGGLVRRPFEHERVTGATATMEVKAPSLESDVETLSGGNQQKVVMARALLSDPTVLLCDEPTQGVDAGARVEIYKLLRELAADGKAVIVLSSDALELEGLCDRVSVFSRGHVIATLDGDDVNEENITGTAIRSKQARREQAAAASPSGRASRLGVVGRFLRGDLGPAAIIAAGILLLALYTAGRNDTYLSDINVESVLFLAAALILVSLGQLVVIVTAGIDLSVGPLMGLTVIVLSSHVTDEGGTGGLAVGLAMVLGLGVLVGLVHGVLIRWAKIGPVIATLATFIFLQGVSLLLRPTPEGNISISFIDRMLEGVGVVPYVFIVVVAIAVGADFVLRRRRAGMALRAVGSDETSAHRIGVPVTRTIVTAYVLCSVFTVLAGILLAAQVGIGDATVGTSYTLASVTAVVLGGASIYGGRGSFLSVALGAVLVTQIINATTFLDLSQAWQYWLPGALILVAGGLFARARGIKVAALETT